MTDQPEKQVVMCGHVEMTPIMTYNDDVVVLNGSLGIVEFTIYELNTGHTNGHAVFSGSVNPILARSSVKGYNPHLAASKLWEDYCKNCQLMFGSNPGGF